MSNPYRVTALNEQPNMAEVVGLTSALTALGLAMGESSTAPTAVTTTSATQIVLVIATCTFVPGLLAQTVTLNYDGAAKCSTTVSLASASLQVQVTLHAVFTPGAAQTKNLTITNTGGTVTAPKFTTVILG